MPGMIDMHTHIGYYYGGCRFAGRCPYADAECRESVRVEEVEKGHKVMCLKAGKLS